MCCLCRYSLYLGFEDFRAVFLPDVLHGHFPAAGSCIGFASPVPHLFFARPAEPCGLESVLIFVCIAAVRWLRHCWPTALCAIRLTQTHEPQSSITMPEKAMIFWITSMYSPAVSFILRFLPVVSSAAALLWMSFRRLKAFSYSALIVFIVSGLPPLLCVAGFARCYQQRFALPVGWLIRAKRRYSFFSRAVATPLLTNSGKAAILFFDCAAILEVFHFGIPFQLSARCASVLYLSVV